MKFDDDDDDKGVGDHGESGDIWMYNADVLILLEGQRWLFDNNDASGDNDDVLTLLEDIQPSWSWLPLHKLLSKDPNFRCSTILSLPGDHDGQNHWGNPCSYHERYLGSLM